MRIKIFTSNKNGKIELTKEELESLLNEAYKQGWNDKPYYYSGLWGNGTLTNYADKSVCINSNLVTETASTATNAQNIEVQLNATT